MSKLSPNILEFRKTAIIITCAVLLTACGGGSPSAPPPVPPPSGGGAPSPQQSGDVSISGIISWEDVGVDLDTITLDLSDLITRPARGITVEARDGSGVLVAETLTDAQGQYRVTVPGGTNIRIQALARLEQNAGSSWDISVRDNTNGRSLYTLAGSLTDSGSVDSTRNLTARSGSNGNDQFTGTRASGPFAILDTVYDAVKLFEANDPNIDFPPAQIFWSVNNRRVASGFDLESGELASTAFTFVDNIPTIIVLGDTNTDSDEFDQHVIAHEFGHYFQRTLSRDDSIGGAHSLASRLDPRVAFSEGWGNALSGIVTNDPIYIDAGFGANEGFGFSLERNDIGEIVERQFGFPGSGWFNESSVQSILYDIFDNQSDGPDNISAGFAAIQNVFSNPVFTEAEAATSIFSFTEAIRDDGLVDSAELDALLESQDIFGRGQFGEGETNNGGIDSALPIFRRLSEGVIETLCSVDDAGPFNRIGVRFLLAFDAPNARNYQMAMRRVSGLTGRDPDFAVFNRGNFVTIGNGPDRDLEIINRDLPRAPLIIDAYDFDNLDRAEQSVAGDACFEFTIE